MNNLERKAQVFLYAAILLALTAADWSWYAQRFPNESFVLQLPFIQVVFILWVAAAAACFLSSILLFWKARREQQTHRRRHRR